MAALGPAPGGTTSVYDVTAPTVIKSSAGSIVTVIINGTPTAGALTVNDCATTGAASAANQIASIPSAQLTNLPINFNSLVTQNGIVISAVPTGAFVTVFYA
jgi:hypothetical protein